MTQQIETRDQYDALVVGAGLFGQVIGKELARLGRRVVVADDRRPESGTAPSGMLMKPSWFHGMGKEVHEPALELLHRNYKLEEIEFKLIPKISKFKLPKVKMGKVLYLPHEEVLSMTVTEKSITKVDLDGTAQFKWDRDSNPRIGVGALKFDLIIVAAGIWSNEIVSMPRVQGKKGVSFFTCVSPAQLTDNIIQPWVPYKQLVSFRRNENMIWSGDGSAIKPENWTPDRTEECWKRIKPHIPDTDLTSTQGFWAPTLQMHGGEEAQPANSTRLVHGIRPYVPGHKICYLEKLSKHLWIATGGAKNGAIAAGWAASTIGKQTS